MLAHQRSSKTKLLFITCWRTLWRTTLSEEAAKSLLPDMTFDQKAERAERTGVSRLGLLETAVVSTLSSFEKLVGEIANTSHLLVRHRSDLRCQACNIYRACRQFKFWANNLRSSAKSQIASFRAKNRQHSIAFSSDLTDDLPQGAKIRIRFRHTCSH